MSASDFNRRETLLAFNGGLWQSTFVRFDSSGSELERFPCRLSVQDIRGEIVASLTHLNSGKTRTMAFREPPDEMLQTVDGHWSLGPSWVRALSWGAEFCLCHGDQRRRAVIHYSAKGLESFVLIWDSRSATQPDLPSAPIKLHSGASADLLPGQILWHCRDDFEVLVMAEQRHAAPMATGIRWRPQPGISHEFIRHYAASGGLENG
ncbi:MAG: DUF3598 family protein [Prochlorococcus sp.]